MTSSSLRPCYLFFYSMISIRELLNGTSSDDDKAIRVEIVKTNKSEDRVTIAVADNSSCC